MKREHEFDKAFSSFVDGRKYEKTEEMLFGLVLSAFTAGWNAAGGEKLPKPALISKYFDAECYFKTPTHIKTKKKTTC
ncbi:MAG: hypothetical protein CVU97_05020 [Firmicutes bacterium HGW-Firmicutes-21]|nr:MAG: hypothetical protein CVU97_05020 [Firmicutes bacterium HGW-Firmicutes-21]